MSDIQISTPRTDEATYPADCLGKTLVVNRDCAAALETELAAKDKELADIRAERLRNETFWLGFLQNELATQQKSTNEKNTTQTSF